MIRTGRPSRQDSYEPSGRCFRTCGLRVDLPRASKRRPGASDLTQEGADVKGPVQEDQHARPQQRQQSPGQDRFVPVGRRADSGAEQGSGAGPGHGHQP